MLPLICKVFRHQNTLDNSTNSTITLIRSKTLRADKCWIDDLESKGITGDSPFNDFNLLLDLIKEILTNDELLPKHVRNYGLECLTNIKEAQVLAVTNYGLSKTKKSKVKLDLLMFNLNEGLSLAYCFYKTKDVAIMVRQVSLIANLLLVSVNL